MGPWRIQEMKMKCPVWMHSKRCPDIGFLSIAERNDLRKNTLFLLKESQDLSISTGNRRETMNIDKVNVKRRWSKS